MSEKRICLAIALLVYATAHGKPLAYPGVAGDDGNIVDSAIDAGISTATAAATSYAGSVLETAQKVLENSSTPDAAILPDYLGKGLKWGGAAVSAGKAYTAWKNGNGCEAMYQALKGLAGFIPGFRGFLWQLGLEAAHLGGECIAGIVIKLSDRNPVNIKQAKAAPKSWQTSKANGSTGVRQDDATTDTSKTTTGEGQAEKESAREERSKPFSNTNVVSRMSMADANAQVGVRGWCDCGANHGKICFMGEGAYSSDGTNIGGGDYIYKLCGKCAKLFKPSRSRDEAEIIDLRIERKYKKFVGTERMPTHKYLSLLKQAENKLLDIPDGEIVIHGVCTCKEPDPIVFSYASYAYVKAGKQNLAVCCSCGKEYVSADGSVPCGPTAKREMGLE